MTTEFNLSIILPAHNEGENLGPLLEELNRTLADIPGLIRREVIVVDDQSTDGTFELIQSKAEAYSNLPNLHCVRLSRRGGSHTALRAGMRHATGDAVICLSADGQDDPATIPALIEKWRAGARIVWAIRTFRGNESWMTKTCALAFYKILAFLTPSSPHSIDLSRADFYLLDRRVVESVNRCSERYTSLFGLIAWMGFPQDCVEYVRRERLRGRSKWSFQTRLQLAMDWVLAFSGIPLKIMTWSGLGISCLGFLYALVVIYRTLAFGVAVEGWASLMVVALFLGGLQMAMLGVMGEYLWRNLEESRDRPLYFVENTTFPSG